MAPPQTTVPVPEPPSSRLHGRGAGCQARPMGAKLLTRQSGGAAPPGAAVEDTTMAGDLSGAGLGAHPAPGGRDWRAAGRCPPGRPAQRWLPVCGAGEPAG